MHHTLLELEMAENCLQDVAETDQVRKWHEGYELLGLQNSVVCAKRELGRVQLQMRIWDVFLWWIDDQYHKVAINCGYTTDLPSCSRLSLSPHAMKRRKGRDGTSCETKRMNQESALKHNMKTGLEEHPRQDLSEFIICS